MPGVVLVRFEQDGAGDAARELVTAVVREGRVEDIAPELMPGLVKCGVTHGTEEQLVEVFAVIPGVKYACLDMLGGLAQVFPNDPNFSQQWWAWNTGQTVNGIAGTPGADVCMPSAWSVRTSADVIVAVIDSGVNYLMPDLAANIWTNAAEYTGLPDYDDDGNGIVDDIFGAAFPGEDEPDPVCLDGIGPFCGGLCLTSPCDYGKGDPFDIWTGGTNQLPCPVKNGSFGGSHGTPVAQLIGGVGNNGTNLCGAAWGVKILPIRMFGTCQMFRQNETLRTSSVLMAFNYATTKGAKIVNCSFVMLDSEALYDGVKQLGEADILVVAAAGNFAENLDTSGPSARQWPAKYDLPNVLAVAATDQNDKLAVFSNYGPITVDVAAPGENLVPFPNSYYAALTPPCNCMLRGTSFSTPIVSGIAALCRSQYPGMSAEDVANLLVSTSRPVSGLDAYVRSGGVISAAGALGVSCHH